MNSGSKATHRKWITRAIIFAASALMTSGVYYRDHSVAMSAQREEALRWSRQIATQAEGLYLYSRQKNEADPVGWVILHLAQGAEPRVMKISRSSTSENTELALNESKGVYTYTRKLSEEGVAIRIEIEASYVGFLGAHPRLLNDLLVLSLFAGISALFFMVLRKRERSQSEVVLHSEALQELITSCLKDSKGQLTQLGLYVRDLVKGARNLAQSASRSRAATLQFKNRVHSEIVDVRACREVLAEFERQALQSETLTLNLVIEAARLGEEGRHLGRMCEELHNHIKKMRKQHQTSEELMTQIEIQIEPLATDADMAYNSFEDIFGTTQMLDTAIKKTTETMLANAKLIQSYNQKVSELNEGAGETSPVQMTGNQQQASA